MLRIGAVHDHTHKCQSIFFRICYQRISGVICKSGLTTSTIFVQILSRSGRIQHLMVITEWCRLCMLICRRNLISSSSNDLAECFIFISCTGNQSHIMCGSPVIFVWKTIRIVKMCIGAAEILCSAVHQVNKRTVISAKLLPHMLCNCISTFIG